MNSLSEFSDPTLKVLSNLQTMMGERYPGLVEMEGYIGTNLTHVAYNSIRIRELKNGGCQNE